MADISLQLLSMGTSLSSTLQCTYGWRQEGCSNRGLLGRNFRFVLRLFSRKTDRIQNTSLKNLGYKVWFLPLLNVFVNKRLIRLASKFKLQCSNVLACHFHVLLSTKLGSTQMAFFQWIADTWPLPSPIYSALSSRCQVLVLIQCILGEWHSHGARFSFAPRSSRIWTGYRKVIATVCSTSTVWSKFW